jgi:hypothetical protein
MEQTNNGIVPKGGWSWGAFMLNVYFLIGAKRYKFLWWFLLALIPIVNIIFIIIFVIYLGVNGHKIAAGGTQFSNQSEYDGYVKGLDHAGKIMFFVVLALVVIGIIFFIAGISFGPWGMMHSMQPMQPATQY